MIRYLVLVEGQVQHVGFRGFCARLAGKYHLTGKIQNLDNGMVRLEIQGKEEDIDSFFKSMLEGDRFIHVSDYHLKRLDVIPDESSFRSLY